MIAVGYLALGAWAFFFGYALDCRRRLKRETARSAQLVEALTGAVAVTATAQGRVQDLEEALEEAQRALRCCERASLTEARAAAKDALVTLDAVLAP